MKTLNNFRTTNKISILSNSIKEMAQIQKHFEDKGFDLVGIGCDDLDAKDTLFTQYVVRVDTGKELKDYLVKVAPPTLMNPDSVHILEETTIKA